MSEKNGVLMEERREAVGRAVEEIKMRRDFTVDDMMPKDPLQAQYFWGNVGLPNWFLSAMLRKTCCTMSQRGLAEALRL